METLIIEPHYDDAWLSMGNYILNANDVGILSLSSSKGYNDKSETHNVFAGLDNVTSWVDLAFRDYQWKDRKLPDAKDLISHNALKQVYVENYSEFKSLVSSVVEISSNYKTIFLPLGLQHPMHMITSVLEDYLPREKVYFYADNPYYFKKKFANLTKEILENFRIKEMVCVDEIGTLKSSIFKKCYPSQWFFQHEACEKNPEIILERK